MNFPGSWAAWLNPTIEGPDPRSTYLLCSTTSAAYIVMDIMTAGTSRSKGRMSAVYSTPAVTCSFVIACLSLAHHEVDTTPSVPLRYFSLAVYL